MKKKLIISSVLVILLCLGMMIGVTLALFTCVTETDVAVCAGDVSIRATVENLEMGSTLGQMLSETQITYADGEICLERIVPGDFVKFDLRIHNSSDVQILYRTRLDVQEDEGLWDGLTVTIGDVKTQGMTRLSAWASMEPECQDVVVSVTVCLPETAGNEYMNTSCRFSFRVEAVQGNANVDGVELADGIFYNAGESTYRIYNANGLRYLSALSREGNDFARSKVLLMADIDLEYEPWTPIVSFAGEFDGNGKTISNLSVTVDADNPGGLFNVIEAGEGERVHDLTISNVRATVGNGRFGTLANLVKGIVNRVTVENVQVTTTCEEAWVGGMCGFMYWPWMNDCTVRDLTVDAQEGASLVAGFSPVLQKNSNMAFTNCNVEGFRLTIHSETGALVGGFVGQTQRGWEDPKLEDCHVTGLDITASGWVQIGGFIAAPGAHTTAVNCSAQGKIDATGLTDGVVGGFLGDLGWNDDLADKGGHKLIACKADVDITTATVTAGGFVGSATNSKGRSMTATFVDCVASGDITLTAEAWIGGFAGEADRGTYIRCQALGTVTGAEQIPFIGYPWSDGDVTILP